MKFTSHVLIVKDMTEAQEYYRNVLGFTVDGEFVNRDGVHFLFKENKTEGAVRPNNDIGTVLDTYVGLKT
jgi:catechol 2,3-dioxygenase-like lactoylglutathione lyase family enzyme